MEKYGSYKDSGVKWLGEIPEHWDFMKMKFMFKDISIKNRPDLELLSVTQNQGVVPRDLVESRMVMPSGNLESFKVISKGDFAISLRSFEGGLEYSDYEGIISPAYTVLKSQKEICHSYYKYLFKSTSFIGELQLSIVGIREGKNISYEELKYSYIQIPPLPEQAAIAEFLDAKTAKIDQAISLKQKEIDLLKERRQILIQELVTGKKVWDGKAWTKPTKTKNSGVEWIGDIPEDWEVRKLKYLLKEVNIRSETGEEELLSLSKYKGVIPKSELEERAGAANSLIGYKKVFDGNLVINKMQVVNGLLAVSNLNGITSPDYSIYTELNNRISLNYIERLFVQNECLAEFKKRVTGVMEGFIRLYTDNLFDIIVHLPPIMIQNKIVDELKKIEYKIDNAVNLKQQEIEKLKEYKTVLINNVVTGKVKVCKLNH